MGENSNIDWTDHTWNPWQGCKKISAGCQNCYMFRDKKLYGQDPSVVVRSSDQTFNKPLRWKDPAKVFVCSWSDFFIEDADAWRDDAWDIIRQCPHLTFQLLTKRPENILDRLPGDWGRKGYDNVWIGVTAENQEEFNTRVQILIDIPVPVRFISMEPLLGPIDFGAIDRHLNYDIDWVIVGGESGPNPRQMDPEWASDILRQCTTRNIPFFMKQMSGRTKKIREAIPDHLNIREFPR